MKKFLLLAGVLTFAVSVRADDAMTIARQRAKDTSQAVSAGQPVTHGNPRPGAVAPGAAAPPSPAIIAMQQNISSIAADLETLQKDSSKKQPLINDLNAAALGTSPTRNAVTKLATDFATALTGKNLSLEQRTKLAQYLRAFFNSSHLSPGQQRTILDDVQKILQAGGISTDDSAKIVADFKAIAAETK